MNKFTNGIIYIDYTPIAVYPPVNEIYPKGRKGQIHKLLKFLNFDNVSERKQHK